VLFALSGCSDGDDNDEPEPPVPPVNASLPEVKTLEASDVTESMATLSGEVISDNGYRVIERGFIYATSENPVMENATKVVCERGTGEYSETLRNLTHNTRYYFRAYATNSQGTAYGDVLSFSTLPKNVLNVNVNGVVMTMVLVEGGTFTMGAESSDNEAQSYEKPAHNVTLDSYYIGLCEVSQEVWEAVVNGHVPTLEENPNWNTERFMPKAMVSYNECVEFIAKLNEITGMEFSLPTEAQWEYAARGGKNSLNYKYAGSNDIESVCWYYDNALSNVAMVGSKAPNELGLFDMCGNVNEWCADWYDYYSSDDQTNPVGPDSGKMRVMRGGSVINTYDMCRITHRFGGEPKSHFFFVGFRLALKL